MPDDRLSELLSQRALLSRHIAWLDAEIARASTAGSVSFQPAPENIQSAPKKEASPSPTPLPVVPAISPGVPVGPETSPIPETEPEQVPEAVALANKRADEIIANYAATDSFNPESTRRSCLLLAIGVFLIGTAALIGIYLFNYR